MEVIENKLKKRTWNDVPVGSALSWGDRLEWFIKMEDDKVFSLSSYEVCNFLEDYGYAADPLVVDTNPQLIVKV